MAANAPLTIRFATDVASAKSGIQDLAASVVSNMIKVGSAVKAANDNVSMVASGWRTASAAVSAAMPVLVAVAGAAAAYKIVSLATDAATESIAEYVAIANKARDLGTSPGFMQRWAGEAKALGIEAEKLEAMLAHARDATASRIGEGDNAASSAVGNRLEQNVRAGNLSRGDLNRYNDAQSQEDKYRVILGLIEQLQQKGAQLAALDLAGKVFGSDFENKLRAGVDMVGQMKQALDSTAQTAGGTRIISDDELRNAQEIQAQIERIDSLLADALAPIQQDLVRLGQDQYRGWLDIKEAIAGAVKTASELYAEVKQVLAAIDAITGKNPLGSLATALGAQKLGDLLGIKPYQGNDQQGPQLPPGGLRLKVNPKTDTSRSLPSLHPSAGGAGESDDPIERYLKQLQKASDTAKAELESVGKTNVEREKAVDLAKLDAAAREAGRTASDEERAKVVQLAEATGRLKDRTLDAKQALEQTAEAMRNFGQLGVEAISDMLIEGKSFSDVLGNIEKQLAKQLLSAAITGTGPLAGILGLAAPASAGSNASGGLLGLLGTGLKGATSGFRANGGPVSAGRAYTVGELGQELFVPNQDGRMVPIDRSGGMGGGGVSLTINDHAGVSVQPQVRRGSDGSLQLMVDVVTRRQAQEAARGRGDLARTGAVSQRLRG